MSANHGGPITQKPISDIAKYIKNLIPANIPESYMIKPIFRDVANDENIRRGIIAYRDFLYVFCDLLITEGDLYVKPQKNPKSITDYPFLYCITDLLVDIGYHGVLSKSGDSLLITKLPSFTASVDGGGNRRNPKNSASKLIECLRFLTLCGFVFNDVDLNVKTLNVSEMQFFEVSYPNAPIMLTGLKAMSIADIDMRTKRYKNDNNHDNLLRCDFRLIKEEDTDVLEVLKDFLHPLSEEVQKFALELHQRYIDRGMICTTNISTYEVHFAYLYVKNSRRVLSAKSMYQLRTWEFSFTVRDGYCLIVRAKNTDKYADVIGRFSISLQEQISKGYGCDRKLRNEPCQKGCQGFRLPLDDSILGISMDIETWLDQELRCVL